MTGTEPPEPHQAFPRAFLVHRDKDITGISGTGLIAEGVTFSDGWTATHWLSRPPTCEAKTEVWHNPDGTQPFEKVSGHGGATYLEWLDAPSRARGALADALALASDTAWDELVEAARTVRDSVEQREAALVSREGELALTLLRTSDTSWADSIDRVRALLKENAELWRQLEAVRDRDGLGPDVEAARLRLELHRAVREGVGDHFVDDRLFGSVENAVEAVWPIVVRLLVQRDESRGAPAGSPGRSRTTTDDPGHREEIREPDTSRHQELLEVRDAVADALTEEHLRRAAEATVALPQEHSRAMADAVRPILIRLLAQRDGVGRARDRAQAGVLAARRAVQRWRRSDDPLTLELAEELAMELDAALTQTVHVRNVAAHVEVCDPCPYCTGGPLFPRRQMREHLGEKHAAVLDLIQSGNLDAVAVSANAIAQRSSDLEATARLALEACDSAVSELPVACPYHGEGTALEPRPGNGHAREACCDTGRAPRRRRRAITAMWDLRRVLAAPADAGSNGGGAR